MNCVLNLTPLAFKCVEAVATVKATHLFECRVNKSKPGTLVFVRGLDSLTLIFCHLRSKEAFSLAKQRAS